MDKFYITFTLEVKPCTKVHVHVHVILKIKVVY